MADFLTINSLADLQFIEANGIEENLTLEYKSSEALCKEKADDMCKDVSAFANSSGGQIIYGMREDNKKPQIDAGVSDPKISKEWIQQILNTRLRPRVPVEIDRIEISSDHFAFVVTVPQTRTGPHQHVDKRYYRRYEATQLVMDDQEIRDVMGRATTPDLFVTLSFLEGNQQALRFPGSDEESRPFNLIAHIENRSPQPAFHVVVDIGIDADFTIISRGDFVQFASDEQVEQTSLRWLRWTLAAPPGQPVFKEYPRLVSENVIMLAISANNTRTQEILDLTVRVVSPGCSRQENWSIVARGPRLTLYPPDSNHTAKRPVS